MQKKYLAPWMQVQVFDEETLTREETGDDSNIYSAFDEGDEDGGLGDGDSLF